MFFLFVWLVFLVWLLFLHYSYMDYRLEAWYATWLFSIIENRKIFTRSENMDENENSWGTWVVQSVKHPTLDFGSGPDLTVHEFKPHIGL